ncbi:unnamed protein product [Sphenostylis stenocarpa]|uniref:Uncharacterized protein n=1 Tax=Sphenostylis stenocarpa TaxID=92480 RepID=A0AA86W103_9FABA|nr:unnamed protein product [Sphenostylis stenocarpa]
MVGSLWSVPDRFTDDLSVISLNADTIKSSSFMLSPSSVVAVPLSRLGSEQNSPQSSISLSLKP